MDFKRDELHQDILDMVHDFAVNEVKPLAAEIDKTEEFPMENVKKMAEMGLMGIPFPEEYGGAGMDTLAYIQTVEELSKYCGTTGVIVSAHTSLCCTPEASSLRQPQPCCSQPLPPALLPVLPEA